MTCRTRIAAFLVAAYFDVPPRAHAAFERPPVGPECAAAGEIASVEGDPTFGNPAAPFDAEEVRIEAWSARPFGIEELRESQGSLWARRHAWGVGGGFRTLGSSEYFEREARAAVSLAPSRILSAGIAARALFAGGTSFTMERGFAADFGLRARLDHATEIGLRLESVLGGAPGDPDRRLARSSIGFARALPGLARVLIEVGRRADRDPTVSAGATWSPHWALTLRAGIQEEPSSVSWGATLRVSRVGLSFSSTEADPLGRTLRVGAAYTEAPRAR